VNTASRMESNGLPGKIQVSEATANLLMAAGKGEWVSEREGGIEAKGKGDLKTFWVQTKTKSLARSLSMTDSSSEDYTCSDPSSTMDKSADHTTSLSCDSTHQSRVEREHNTSEDKKVVGGNNDVSEDKKSSNHRVNSFADEDVEKVSSEIGNTSGTEDSFFDDTDPEELYFV
jgi:Adenylate and Guanylate cyclase catalytic domain